MKKYRAVVIDGKKALRRIVAAATLAIVLSVGLLNIKIADVDISLDSQKIAERNLSESIPQIAGLSPQGDVLKKAGMMLRKAVSFVLGFDLFDPRTTVFAQVPLIQSVSRGFLASAANADVSQVFNPINADKGEGEAEPKPATEGTHPICEVDSSQAKTLGNSKNKILIRNETSFGINVDEFLNEPLKFDMKGDGPKVLILHTHATESYSPEGSASYSTDKSDRSTDASQNMVAVGEAVKKVFDDAGISAIHDKTLHDHPSFNGSYANSLKTVEKYKAKYPSICIVLDLHRDAYVYDDGSKAKFVTQIDGKKTAQLMLVVGTNGSGLDHPNWRENMKLALKLQNKIISKYPHLMRGVNLRKERFNGHTTPGSMIIEVGSSGNTLSEAIRGATLGAREIADFLTELK
ncbi:MAG: stage II sporulation protein P [Clostridia bacterium]|nr:stage II sporulation protein P [Clostridia bacterium]